MAYKQREFVKTLSNKQAPKGFHYMPNGKLMSDADHIALYGSGKVISSFNLDTTNVKAAGETRTFNITGDGIFSLEVKNEDNYYDNIQTNIYQATKTKLSNIVIKN